MKLKLRTYFFLILSFLSLRCQSQKVEEVDKEIPHCNDPTFNQKVKSLIRFSVPAMDVDELHENREDVLILDAREKEEFDISHLPKAKHIGYKKFEENILYDLPKDTKIVVYCSVGYRSEKIGEKIAKMGFSNVFNLYGSIFEWVNRGYEIVDSKENPITIIHTYNASWSQWVINNNYEKVW